MNSEIPNTELKNKKKEREKRRVWGRVAGRGSTLSGRMVGSIKNIGKHRPWKGSRDILVTHKQTQAGAFKLER